MRRTVTGSCLAVLLMAAAWWLAGKSSVSTRIWVIPVMGTVCQCTFELDEKDSSNALKAVNEAFAEVLELANLRDRNSELARLNAEAHKKPFVCSPELYGLLSESRRAYRISGGRFDISVKPLLDLWGFYRKRGKAPSSGEIAEAKKLCGLDKVVFDDEKRAVFFPVEGMALDLGGIAKGYALDLAVKKLDERRISIRRGTVNLGGNIYLLGDGESYNIGIKDPSDPEKIKDIVTLKSPGAVSSSGDYERFVILDGKKFGHIIDPESGIPAPRDYAVTVFSADGISSDWISTSLYLGGRKLQNNFDCQFWIVEK